MAGGVPSDSVGQVTRWLSRDTDKNREGIEKWLARTPQPAAAQTLHKILKHQRNFSAVRLILSYLIYGLIMLAFWGFLVTLFSLMVSLPRSHFLVILFSPLVPMIREAVTRWKQARRIEERAVWLLARLGDAEATRHLAPQWQYVPPLREYPPPTDRQQRITGALTELATVASENEAVARVSAESLRPLLARFLDAGPQAVREAEADLLLAIARCLAKSGTPDDRRVLEHLAAYPIMGDENLGLLVEAARLIVNPPATPAIPATATPVRVTASESAPAVVLTHNP